MHITGHEAEAQGIIHDIKSGNVRPAGYDLTIDKIIIDSSTHERPATVDPQGMFVLISNETIKIPSGYIAYALPKTSLCQEGILTLNTGILDPGYNGLISTVGINFNQYAYTLKPGETFLRLVFHKLGGKDAHICDPSTAYRHKSYYLSKRRKEAERYPNTFMDIENVQKDFIDEINEKLFQKQIRSFGIIASIIGVIFTATIFGMNKYSEHYVLARIADSKIINESIHSLDKNLTALTLENNYLKQELFSYKADIKNLAEKIDQLDDNLSNSKK